MTYNGAQSWASTLDAYMTYRYLTEEAGLKFDLVVLTTPLNDMDWQILLASYGYPFLADTYAEGFRTYLASELASVEPEIQDPGPWVTKHVRFLGAIQQGLENSAGGTLPNPVLSFRQIREVKSELVNERAYTPCRAVAERPSRCA